ncbi:hypothetical protein C8T65DRAFT_738318 [Cerioporus squamosus]|nr:hypothetical protein C8T65DRAFT_738318 [Cerioporus squamosus]
MTDTLLALLSCVVALCLFLAFKVLQWVHGEADPKPVRRTQTLTYTYSATATVQSQHPTYLSFPAPPLPRHNPAAKATILKDFTTELHDLGLRAVGDAPFNGRQVEPVSAVATGREVQAGRNRSSLRIHMVSGRVANHHNHEASEFDGDHEETTVPGKGKMRAVSPVAGSAPHDISSPPATARSPPPAAHSPPPMVHSPLSPEPTGIERLWIDDTGDEAEAGPSNRDVDWSRSSSPLTELSSEDESETEASRPAGQELTRNALLRFNSSIDPTDYIERKKRKQSASEGRLTVWWFETKSSTPIDHPPDLSRRRDLEEEDLFLHRHGDNDTQFWIWITEPGRAPRWKRILLGYRRPSDGRYLTLTETHKKPSWLLSGWFKARERQNRL